MKDGVRYEVNTTEELLRQVADSVEDVSYEQIQFEETLSDDTEVEIPDAQESEEESGTFHFRWLRFRYLESNNEQLLRYLESNNVNF